MASGAVLVEARELGRPNDWVGLLTTLASAVAIALCFGKACRLSPGMKRITWQLLCILSACGLAAKVAFDLRSGEYLAPVMGVLVCLAGLREVWMQGAEHALFSKWQTSDARFQQVMDYNMTGLFRWNLQGEVIEANDACLEMIGYTRDDLKAGRINWRKMTPPEFADRDEKALAEIRKSSVCQPYEKEFIRKDGTRLPVLVGASALPENPEISIGFLVDISARCAAEQDLREAESRYRTLVDNARDAIFTISSDGIFTSLNPAAAAITGFPVGEWLDRPFFPIVHPDDQAHSLELFNAALRGEKLPPFELRIRTNDGGSVLLEFTITPHLKDGNIVALIGIGRDIGRRRQLEEQLRQAQKMESIGQLAGGVAHDFNNLLTVVQGNASLMLMDESLKKDTLEMAGEICEAADRASTLTRQLLAFSRRQLVQACDVNLQALVSNLGKMLHRLLGEDITLQVESASGLPAIHGDPGMMEQVILNLAINSRDAMPQGGRLTIVTSHLQVPDDIRTRNPEGRSGHFVRLAVSDSGSGITPENLSRIFEPFFTTKHPGKGTGLGLATVYGIVKQHRGWIEVRSEVGKGTTFEIFLPAMEGRPAAPVEPKETELPRGTETILLVEDEHPVRDVMREVLSRLGYQVLEAGTGLEALELWESRQKEIDMLFADVVLPDGLSGPQLADILRASAPDLKVLFTSGHSAKLAFRGRRRSSIKLLQKPFRPQELAEAMRSVLGENHAPENAPNKGQSSPVRTASFSPEGKA